MSEAQPPSQSSRVSVKVALLAVIALFCGTAAAVLSIAADIHPGLALLAGAGAAAGAWRFSDDAIH
ncbi:hypothetical protein [Nocardiopsis tropica]|uniref:Uncharacterized protein n=1 Tax=Nocardiopsis tropica TaxID=109330 RepID=A0ABV1ZWJ6_9ACTN